MATEVTVGIDIGTTSVKAVAADAEGRVVARQRVPHDLRAGHAGELAHDAAQAWHHGVRAALEGVLAAAGAEVGAAGGALEVAAVEVAAMVPSLCAVDGDGVPISDGLLYGDSRGAPPPGSADAQADPSQSGELVRFLAWLVEHHPDAAGYWPAQAVANAALGGVGAIDTTVAMTTLPLFDFTGWDKAVAAEAGLDDVSRLPRIVVGTDPVGPVTMPGAAHGVPLGGGTIDALGEQLVAAADEAGDVLVILGSTLIVWAVIPEWREEPGVWSVPHTAPGKSLIGGPSNAGGLFLNWADRLLAGSRGRSGSPGPSGGNRPPTAPVDAAASSGAGVSSEIDPGRVPVWLPYLRGERVPFHDPDRRASLHDLDIGMGPDAARRAAYEASGFAVRHLLDLGRSDARRIVATGGGVRDAAWVQALADATGLPVDPVAVPEGGALGAAWLARAIAGQEAPGATGERWARSAPRVEPDPAWAPATAARYARYRELTG